MHGLSLDLMVINHLGYMHDRMLDQIQAAYDTHTPEALQARQQGLKNVRQLQ